MRSPLAAWRRLFAIGGAPAASHVVLSRAPSSERMLEPLKNARIVGAASLEELTRPLDVAGILGRVSTSAPAAAFASGSIDGDDIGERSTTRDASPQNVGTARARGARAARTGTPLELRAAARGRDSSPQSTLDSGGKVAATSPGPSVLSTSDEQLRDRRARIATDSARRAATVAARFGDTASMEDFTRGAVARADLPVAARAGSVARVLLDAPVVNVDRLLQPIPTPSVGASPPTREQEVHAAKALPRRDAAGLLTAVVERARVALAAGAPPPADAPRATSDQQIVASALDAQTSSRAFSNSTSNEPARQGGFRGLAQRTMTVARATSSVKPQRIEPETHVSSDLAADSLDSRVADSLARVLEREARRHGIDVDEARS